MAELMSPIRKLIVKLTVDHGGDEEGRGGGGGRGP